MDRAYTDSGTTVRMEFTGTRTGSVSFRINGQMYRGGNNALDKYVRARPEDVAGLERTGQWRQVRRTPPPPPPQEPQSDAAPALVSTADDALPKARGRKR